MRMTMQDEELWATVNPSDAHAVLRKMEAKSYPFVVVFRGRVAGAMSSATSAASVVVNLAFAWGNDEWARSGAVIYLGTEGSGTRAALEVVHPVLKGNEWGHPPTCAGNQTVRDSIGYRHCGCNQS